VDNDEVTRQTLAAWDEIQAEDETAEEPTDEVDEVDAGDEIEEPEEAEAEEPDDGEEEETEETDEDEGEVEGEDQEEDQEPVVATAYDSEDIEIRAFLAKYGGDLNAALKGAAEIHHLINRQGQEKNQALQRVQELEAELEQARLVTPGGLMLNDEQREWVETATESGNPVAYISQAVQAGEYELARAVCREWAREDPFSANRAGQYVDQTEAQAMSYVEPIDMGRLLDAMKTEIPDMPNYSAQMAQVIHTLGDEHPIVQDARSGDIMVAAQAIARIYEYAKTSTATVKNARQKVLDQQRRNGAVAKQKAQVSSASASPSAIETPRPVTLGPGLTLEQLEAEFAR
jgi:hypothetical protein